MSTTLPSEVAHRLHLYGSIRRYAFDNASAGALAYIFQVPGFLHSTAILSTVLPNLDFDNDGLLVKLPATGLYTKDGLLANNLFVPYHPWLSTKTCMRSLSFGFIETLLEMKRERTDIKYFGLRLNEDIVMNASFYEEWETRAYIWGPTGLTEEKLVHPKFPEVPSRTLTVHSRVDDSPFLRLLFLGLSHIEVMWSRRGMMDDN